MVDVITTLTFELTKMHDADDFRVVVELPEGADGLRSLLSRELGAKWPDDDQHFEIELQYARTAVSHLKQFGVHDFQLRPADARWPLAEIVDEAVAIASAREGWMVSEVDVLEERVAHVTNDRIERLKLRGCFVVRVTQKRT